MAYHPKFSELLLEYLKKKDRSPAWLADRVGIDRSTINRWLNHDTRPGDSETIIWIAAALELNVEECDVLLSAAKYPQFKDLQEKVIEEKTKNAIEEILSRSIPVRTLPWQEQAYFSLHRNFIDFSSYITRKTEGFVGRKFVFDALDRYLESHVYKSGYFIIRGEPGIGKTAFMAQLVKQRGYPHHFNIAAEGITQQQFFLNASSQIIARHHLNYMSLPYDADKNNNFLKQVLREAAEKNGKVILVVDALDEAPQPLDNSRANPLYLPADLPDGVYIIVSTRRTNRFIELEAHNYEVFELEESSENNLRDVTDYINLYVSRKAMMERLKEWRIDLAHFVTIMCEKSEGNFMYLFYVLRAVEIGDFTIGGVDELPLGLRGYYQRHWEKMRGQDLNNFVHTYQNIIAKFATAREPVSAEWIGFMADIDVALVLWGIEKWWEFLHELMLDGKKRYRIYHQSYTDFLAQKIVEQG